MAGFKMKVSNDAIEGKDVMVPGQYEVKLISFNPKVSKKGDTVNLNPCFEVVNHPEYAGRKIYDTLNSAGAWVFPDFVHMLGFAMGTDGDNQWIPTNDKDGQWNADPATYKEDDPSTWKYAGPLVGRNGKIELVVDSYNGKPNNKISRYFCAVENCATKFPKITHSTNLMRKAS